MENEKDLIDKVCGGDERAFAKLVEQYHKLVAHMVYRMVYNQTDRDDICQEVFIKVFKSIRKFDFRSKLSTWIARIAYNSCVDYLRRKKIPLAEDQKRLDSSEDQLSKHENSVWSTSDRPDLSVERSDVHARVQIEIDQIPAHYRSILTLYHMEEMSYSEIGEIMDLPEGTVKSYLFRARKILKERLLQDYSEEELCL